MLTRRLADFVTQTDGKTVSEVALARAQDALVDTIGVMIGGSREDVARIGRRWVSELGGKPNSTVIGTLLAAPIPEAAFANGVAAHALDFDDSLPSLRGHPSAVLVPTILAVAEGTGASGRDVLTSYVLGLEIAGKLGRAIGHHHYLRGWHTTATVGVFAATAAAARLWRMNAAELATAWGMAASMSAGLVCNFGTMTKAFQVGHAARSAVTAAWMARNGCSAEPEIFDRKNGFLQLYGGEDGERLEELAEKLGDPWEIVSPGIYVKGWACCYCSHRAIGGLLEMMAQHQFDARDIQEIAIGFPPGADRALIKRDPRTGLEAKFSVEYAAAATVLNGKLSIDSFTDKAAAGTEVRELMKRVRPYPVAADGIFSGLVGFTDLSVKTRDTLFETRIDRVPGSPQWPLSLEQRTEKFLDCTTGIIGLEPATHLLNIARQAIDLADIGQLTGAARVGSQITDGPAEI